MQRISLVTRSLVSPLLIHICVLSIGASGANRRYSVEPVMLSNGYSLAGGFIETDGTLGHIEPENIIDYKLVVEGEDPFEFSPLKPRPSLRGSLNASAIELTVMRATGDVLPEQFIFNNRFGLDPGLGTRFLVFANIASTDTSAIGYGFVSELSADIYGSFAMPQGESLLVASVPEPYSLLLLSVGVFAAACGSRGTM